MAEDAVFLKTAVKRFFKNVHIVNAFPNKRAFGEKILVNVGNRSCVRIDAWLIAMKAGVDRASCLRHAYGDARLQDAIAFCYALLFLAVNRMIKRVRQRGDHLPGCSTRQHAIRIKRNYKLYRLQGRNVTHYR